MMTTPMTFKNFKIQFKQKLLKLKIVRFGNKAGYSIATLSTKLTFSLDISTRGNFVKKSFKKGYTEEQKCQE